MEPSKNVDERMTNTLINSQYIVFGLGKTGLSCARFLTQQRKNFTVIDTQEHPSELDNLKKVIPNAKVITGINSFFTTDACKHLILSPGVSRAHPFVITAQRKGIEVIGDIELFARHVKAPVIAITGSNGKSTVVTMVSEILRGANLRVLHGGNLGIPALDLLIAGQPDCFVLELSSFQLESTESLAPSVACILNISPDHMDRYEDFASYIEVKRGVYNNAASVVLNADDEILRDLRPQCETHFISHLGIDMASYRIEVYDGELWLIVDGGRIMRVNDLATSGLHNAMNALAALAITDRLSVSRSVQKSVLASFRGLPHRCQTILTRHGVEWIDDSKGTNVGAASAAVRSIFSGRQGVLIAGGRGKGADFSVLAKELDGRAHSVILIGEDADAIAASLDGRVKVYFALNMKAAVSLASRLVSPGEAVLLSPACSSFDMFHDFEERGRAFSEAVRERISQ